MMSPYEGERIFEAEMVRLHQCDRTLYACKSRAAVHAPDHITFWQWLKHSFATRPAAVDPLTPQAARVHD